MSPETRPTASSDGMPGDVLAELGRQANLTVDELAALEQMLEKTPDEPVRIERLF